MYHVWCPLPFLLFFNFNPTVDPNPNPNLNLNPTLLQSSCIEICFWKTREPLTNTKATDSFVYELIQEFFQFLLSIRMCEFPCDICYLLIPWDCNVVFVKLWWWIASHAIPYRAIDNRLSLTRRGSFIILLALDATYFRLLVCFLSQIINTGWSGRVRGRRETKKWVGAT